MVGARVEVRVVQAQRGVQVISATLGGLDSEFGLDMGIEYVLGIYSIQSGMFFP